MSLLPRILSAFFTAIPAVGFGILILTFHDDDYYWPTYFLTCAIFLVASLLLGFFLPPFLQRLHITRPWIWLLIQGFLAWAIAIVVLLCLNVTPLCEGQDNGDGNNDLALCVVQSLLVALVYSPLEVVLLLMSAAGGGMVLARRKSEPQIYTD